MKALVSTFRGFLREEGGATAIEYGLIATLIAVVIIAAVTNTGLGVKDAFCDVASAMGHPCS